MCGPSNEDDWAIPPRVWGWLALFVVSVVVFVVQFGRLLRELPAPH